MAKKNIFDFYQMKERGDKITYLTAYDFPTASLLEQVGIDMLLVGDSLGMVVYGYSGTIPVTMDQMIVHSQAVRRGAPNTFIIGDMPFLSYQKSVEDAIENAGRFLKEAGVDAVKLEGGKRVIPQIKGLVDSGMLVMGHIGLTPQSSGQLGGFRAQATTAEGAIALLEDAKAIEDAGAFSLLLEAIPAEIGKLITENLKIPTLGIGAGPHCDGQVLIIHDMLGVFEVFTPKFVKKYANLAEEMRGAIREYISDIKNGRFPSEEHCYKMRAGERERLKGMLEKVS
jgi:3-methyl-2-oxobutanoate hydroxymethyltransferase